MDDRPGAEVPETDIVVGGMVPDRASRDLMLEMIAEIRGHRDYPAQRAEAGMILANIEFVGPLDPSTNIQESVERWKQRVAKMLPADSRSIPEATSEGPNPVAGRPSRFQAKR